jgi:hypothetical protein
LITEEGNREKCELRDSPKPLTCFKYFVVKNLPGENLSGESFCRDDIDLQRNWTRLFVVAALKMNKQKSRKREYPDHTPGSKLAAEARKLANSLTDEERAQALQGAKLLIYGRARNKQTAGARR